MIHYMHLSNDQLANIYEYKTLGFNNLRINDFIYDEKKNLLFFNDINEIKEIKYNKKENSSKFISGLRAENIEQICYAHLLNDNRIISIICTGEAGSGKTLLGVGHAFEKCKDSKIQLVISRPPVSPSKKFDMGFLPGSLDDKLDPWLKVFDDNLDKIRDLQCNNTKIAIRKLSLEHIKGLTFDNSIVIIDEAEDLNNQEVKAIMTRIGINSKLILLGDEEQTTSGDVKKELTLSGTVKKFRNKNTTSEYMKMFADINLKTSLRSDFVNYVLEVL